MSEHEQVRAYEQVYANQQVRTYQSVRADELVFEHDMQLWFNKISLVNQSFTDRCDWIEYYDLYHGRENAIIHYPLYKNALIYGQCRRHLQHLNH